MGPDRPADAEPRAERGVARAGAFVFRTACSSAPTPATSATRASRCSAIHGDAAQRGAARAGVEVRLGWRAERIEPDADAGGFASTAGGERARGRRGGRSRCPHERAVGAAARRRAARRRTRWPRLGQLADRQPARRLRPPRARHAVRRRRRLAGAVGVRPHRRPRGWSAASTWRCRCRPPTRRSTRRRRALRERYLPALRRAAPGRARRERVERFFVTREHAATFRAAPGRRARCGPARAPGCPASCWPAPGPTPAGRRRWRARSAAATRPRARRCAARDRPPLRSPRQRWRCVVPPQARRGRRLSRCDAARARWRSRRARCVARRRRGRACGGSAMGPRRARARRAR